MQSCFHDMSAGKASGSLLQRSPVRCREILRNNLTHTARFDSGIPYFLLCALIFFCLFVFPSPCTCQEAVPAPEPGAAADAFQRFKLVFEPDAYYSDVDLIFSLTDAPIPHLGELTEMEIYYTLLSRAALLPQFLVLEASYNPLPNLGVYLKENNRSFYDNARVSGSFNWIKAGTAGFEEPWAFSVLAGNVANFYEVGNKVTKGLGYSGYLFSYGNYHIKDNTLIKDDWKEFEWKMKGDRKSDVKKLSWSFRIGAKIHDNHDITDILYLSFRRSRVDYLSEEYSLFHNSGFEYAYDMGRRNFSAIRHYFFIDKKWPMQNSKTAFSLALGFVWESAKKYTGALADGSGRSNFQFIFRPNIEF
jgi:hypothetical protein